MLKILVKLTRSSCPEHRLSIAQAIACALCLTLTLISVSYPRLSQAAEPSQVQFQEKLYRQALYFYFSGDYASSLRQVSLNRQRFNTNTAKTDLFEAGLLVSVGLHSKAAETLSNFEHQQSPATRQTESTPEKNGKSNTSADEIRLIALLQLAEQQIQNGNNQAAKQTLNQISGVPASYADQYHVLSQLAYWPEAGQIPTSLDESTTKKPTQETPTSLSSAYIALNDALRHIEQEEPERASPILATIKSQQWFTPESTFWQKLFNPFSESLDERNPGAEEPLQQQAISDYAKLLMAQMYVKQQNYQAAYTELSDFPKDSPYSESALFLFAYAAQKSNQLTTSLKLFDLMQQQYPYSHLGWQSALLMANQIEGQSSFKQAMPRYVAAEKLYLNTLSDLDDFQQAFSSSKDLLRFGVNNSGSTDKELISPDKRRYIHSASNIAPLAVSIQSPYVSQSPWLKKALVDPQLQSAYHTLVELNLLQHHLQVLLTKSQWIKTTIELNKQRKAKVLTKRKQNQHSTTLATLVTKQQRVNKLVSQAEQEADGNLFATSTQQAQLMRIERSRQALVNIAPHRNTSDYNERLARVKGVLSWTLYQSFPERLRQHQKLLKEVEIQLSKVSENNERFEVLARSQGQFSDFEIRQKASTSGTAELLAKISALRLKTTRDIQAKVQQFVDIERTTLEQLLLTSRHKMADVLEKMTSIDKLKTEDKETLNIPSTDKDIRRLTTEHVGLASRNTRFQENSGAGL